MCAKNKIQYETHWVQGTQKAQGPKRLMTMNADRGSLGCTLHYGHYFSQLSHVPPGHRTRCQILARGMGNLKREPYHFSYLTDDGLDTQKGSEEIQTQGSGASSSTISTTSVYSPSTSTQQMGRTQEMKTNKIKQAGVSESALSPLTVISRSPGRNHSQPQKTHHGKVDSLRKQKERQGQVGYG